MIVNNHMHRSFDLGAEAKDRHLGEDPDYRSRGRRTSHLARMRHSGHVDHNYHGRRKNHLGGHRSRFGILLGCSPCNTYRLGSYQTVPVLVR